MGLGVAMADFRHAIRLYTLGGESNAWMREPWDGSATGMILSTREPLHDWDAGDNDSFWPRL